MRNWLFTSCEAWALVTRLSCTAGDRAIHQPMISATSSDPAAVASHHQRALYAMAGNDTTANRPTERHAGACEPVTAARARATRVDSRAVSAGSCPAVRTADRCVAVRW